MRGLPRALGAVRRSTLGVGILTMALGFALVMGTFAVAVKGLFQGGGGNTVRAVFASAQQLRNGDPVRVDGVEVGRVTGISVDPEGRGATVTMAVNDSARPLYGDARAVLRWRTVLGGAFYVDLERGSPEAGPLASGTIPKSRTTQQVELEDITSVVRGGARRGLRSIPGDVAEAMRDPRVPAGALRSLADAAPSVSRGVGALRGVEQDRDLRALVRETAATVDALGESPEDLRRTVSGAAATLATTARRQADLRMTLASAPGVLGRTDATLDRLDATLRLVDPLIARLRGPAREVAPTVARLRPTVSAADTLLRRARPLMDSLRPAVQSLADAARQGVPLVDALEPSIERLDKTILPYLDERDPETQRTTAEMIGPTFAAVGGGAGQEDMNGHFQRITLTAGNSPLFLPCQVFVSNPDVKELVACRTLESALRTLLSYDPFGPAPGSEGIPPAHEGGNKR